MEYNFREIEQKVKQFWKEKDVYKTPDDFTRPKYYVLDMFPYPSGAGLHVGHPLGYIAADIYSRYKRMKGFNVLHPMGFDAFGLPAEQYAIETGQHPAVTTEQNIRRYKEQLDNIGFDYDWSRELRTSDPQYFKWTQWIFGELFNSWYDRKQQKTRPISELVEIFEKEGNINHPSPADENFMIGNWTSFNEAERRDALMQYRIAYLDYADVWWCEALNTVLANDEVVNGVSERGGFPVERKKMRQWFLRITEYADRLLSSLEDLEWSEAMKEMQRNWVGRSEGAQVQFKLKDAPTVIEVFTTRPDTIFGVDFMVLAPEHELVQGITPEAQKAEVEHYIAYVKSRSERERMAEKKISGVFTGVYVEHPFTGRNIPVWISEYVLAGYGTGAIMAVPAGDERDHAFAKHFHIPVTNIFGGLYNGEEAVSDKNVTIEQSDFISGMKVKEAAATILERIETMGIGRRKVNYKLRDAGFSRQRYWGEPFPIVYKQQRTGTDGGTDVPYLINEAEANLPEPLKELPVALPHVDKYEPGPEGQGPLANIASFMNIEDRTGQPLKRESNTMPGYAGSSWYFLRYMDPHNTAAFAGRKATDYWKQVDLYIGGTEHAVGHLLYSRMWTKALCDLGYISFDEPFKRLLNQGMIQGSTRYVYKVNLKISTSLRSLSEELISQERSTYNSLKELYNIPYLFVSKGIKEELEDRDLQNNAIEKISEFVNSFIKRRDNKNISITFENYELTPLRVDVNLVDGIELDIHRFRRWREEYAHAEFILEDGKYLCGVETEKMSKSKYNVVNPDDIVNQYGADTFRMYEMFLGPIEMSKPWDTKGIEGVHRFLRKFCRLYYNEDNSLKLTDTIPSEKELRILHKTIKKIEEDTERFSFNTGVSQFMICVNELTDSNTTSQEILMPLVQLIAPYAPHLAEHIWSDAGNEGSVVHASFPEWDEKYTVENSKVYPVAVNGKARTEMEFALDAEEDIVKEAVLQDEKIIKHMEGKPMKKFIYVKGRMINIVV